MSKGMRTEDEVRDSAKLVLGFDRKESGVQQGTGQITTFNQLGFRGCNDKPDGWYLPDDASKPAIILETKSETEGVSKEKHVKELFKNIDVVAKKYSKTIGILYSGSAIRVFKNKIELSDASKRLENKDYYIRLCTSQKLDSNYIFEITQKINNSLHFKFGMTDLQDRMIFTACALVAQRYNPQNGLQKLKDMDYSTFHNWIYSALSKALEDDKKQNSKLDVLLEEYASVRMSITENQEAINDFIDNVCQIADLVNSDNWNGEDVMAIFFNEFNRYRGKAQAGQLHKCNRLLKSSQHGIIYSLLSQYQQPKQIPSRKESYHVHPQKRRVRHRLGQRKDSLDRPQTPHHLFSAAVLYEVHSDRDQTHRPAWLL